MINKFAFIFTIISGISFHLAAQDAVQVLTKDIYEQSQSISFAKSAGTQSDSLVGMLATDFKLRTLKGDSIQLSDLKGKVVFMTVFQGSCVPCLREIPLINRMVEKYSHNEVVFIAISPIDTPEDIKVVQSFLSKKGMESMYHNKVVVIPASYLGEAEEGYRLAFNKKSSGVESLYKNETKDLIRNDYKVAYAPTNFFIDKNGIIRWVTYGYNIKYDYFPLYTSEIDALLAE